MMRRKYILILTLILLFKASFGQVLEGEMNYVSYILSKDSMKPIANPITETVSVKGGKYKIVVHDAQKGQLEWQIDNYYEGNSYSRKSYKNVDYAILDKDPTISKEGKLIFEKPDSPLVAPILKSLLCSKLKDSLSVFTKVDTIIMINGFKCNVITQDRGGKMVCDYYYCDSIKLDPIQYACNRIDGLDKLYKLTNGSVIAQLISYDELYTWIYQLQSIKSTKIEDKIFDIPKGIKIEVAK